MHIHKGLLAALLIAAGVCAGVCAGCGDGGAGDDDGGDDDTQPPPASLFDDAITTIELEVDYASGAPPYTGGLGGAFGDSWELFETNAARLFQGAGKTLIVPTTLAAMQELTDVGPGPYTVAEILAVADAHRDQLAAGATATFYVLWLDGYFEDASGERANVLGVSIGATGVLAMFKPVIESTASPLSPNLEKFVEQTTLVHEFGHAVGLVANGVPLTSAHQDEEHGKHCNNASCVMYWANEGAADAAAFARDYVLGGDSVLWGDECLADVDALIAAGAKR